MKKILVIGAGAYQIPLIKRIRELGYMAYCVDGNPNAEGFKYADAYKNIDVTDCKACLAYAKEIEIDGILTYGATITLPAVSYIGKMLGLPALPIETAQISKSKFEIKSKLYECGCNINGDFFEMSSVEEAQNYKFNFPCVIKPSDGSGSKGVSVAKNEQELKVALQFAYDNARYGKIYSEEFIQGQEYGVESFVYNRTPYVYSIMKKTIRVHNDGKVSYGHCTPSGISKEQELQVKEQISMALKALNVTMGSVNFDIIVSDKDKKPYIIDCGIRIGQNLIASHIVPISRGINILDNTIALALGEEIDPQPKQNRCIATRLLIYSPGIISEIKPFDDVIGKNGVISIVMRKGVGEEQRPFSEKIDACGWVIAEGSTPDEAESNAEAAKQRLADYIIIH